MEGNIWNWFEKMKSQHFLSIFFFRFVKDLNIVDLMKNKRIEKPSQSMLMRLHI